MQSKINYTMPQSNVRLLKGTQNCIEFTLSNVLTKNKAKESIAEWSKIFTSNPKTKFTLIWDCLELTDYEPQARSMWQKMLKENKEQIETVWLISDSKVIRTGGALMSMFVKFTIKPVSSKEEIEFNKNKFELVTS